MEIVNHLLKGDEIDYQASPNNSGKFQNEPEFIIIHYTAGASRESSVRSLSDESRKASAHFVVGRDEKITQLVPCDMIAWHAGVSSWEGKSGLNKYSIGIEIDNAGKLQEIGPGRYQSWFQKQYSNGSDVFIENSGQAWHRFTEWQIAAVIELCRVLVKKYPSITAILGHNEISPGRKIDPGPAFPLESLRNEIFFTDRSDEGVEPLEVRYSIVEASSLNFRKKPSTKAALVSKPLKAGTKVEVIEEAGGWSKVLAPVEGWVSSKYIRPLS